MPGVTLGNKKTAALIREHTRGEEEFKLGEGNGRGRDMSRARGTAGMQLEPNKIGAENADADNKISALRRRGTTRTERIT